MTELPVAILAGGLATRLRPQTETIPKSLLEVAGRPFVELQLTYLFRQGIRKVVLCVGHLGKMIQEQVGDGSRFGLSVLYSYDGEGLKGTGGALKRALPLVKGPFFVLYGDSFLPIDWGLVEKAYRSCGKLALMTVYKNHDQGDKSNVLYREGIVLEHDKKHPRPEMVYIDYGLGILAPEAFESYPPDGPLDLADVYHDLAAKGQLAGVEVFEPFHEIGSPPGLAEARQYFADPTRLP